MKQNKKQGFTLIELLAVIVILAIIALIAVPVIMNIINKANKSAFKDSAYGIVSSGELYYAEQVLEPNGMTEDVTITLPDTTKKLQIKGEVPTGSILITTEGKVAIAVHNNRYCVTKGIDDKDITITEDITNCKLIAPNSLTALSTTSSVITNIPECVTNGTECVKGTPVAIKVNENEVYNFYIISETEDEVTLLMDRNIYSEEDVTNNTENVAWISVEDYAAANSDDNTYCDDSVCPDEGPITAVAALKDRTSGWTKIPEREYTYTGAGRYGNYSFTEKMRARILTRVDVNNIKEANNWSTPNWLYTNLYSTGDKNTNGYWLASIDTDDSALFVYHNNGSVNRTNPASNTVGIRPVITLKK